MIFMDKDEFLLKRIRELANLSYQRDIVTFTDFLNLNEQNILNTVKHPGVHVKLFGGYDHAERQIAAFYSDSVMFSWEYPVSCLRITPKAIRFFRRSEPQRLSGSHIKPGCRAQCGGRYPA